MSRVSGIVEEGDECRGRPFRRGRQCCNLEFRGWIFIQDVGFRGFRYGGDAGVVGGGMNEGVNSRRGVRRMSGSWKDVWQAEHAQWELRSACREAGAGASVDRARGPVSVG